MTKASRILITGGDGMLAWDLLRVLREELPDAVVEAVDREGFDITSRESIRAGLDAFAPDWVFNTAAYTNVDGAETDRETAEQVNARGPALLSRACSDSGAKLIHFGTDQVFDGKADHPRREDETPAPCNHYAATKLHGDEAVLSDAGNLVLRVQWLYGQRKDRFTPLRDKQVFSPFADQFGAPTWTREVARTCVRLMDVKASGLFHFAYDDYASWAEVFAFVKHEWGLSVKLEPRETSTLHLPARRPLFSVLSNAKLKAALGVQSMGSWKTPLVEFLDLASR